MNLVYTFWEVKAPVEKLEKVADFLQKYKDRNPKLYYQIAEENNFFPHTRYCGKILDYVLKDGTLFIDEESNRPQVEFIETMLDHFIPEKDYILEYISESDDNGEFFTNKEEYKEKYKLDGEVPELDDLDTYCLSKEELRNVLGCVFKKEDASLGELLEVLEDSDYYYELNVHKWDYTTLAELKGE